LYSPQALSNSDTERGNAAQEIAGELRIMINETRDEILVRGDKITGLELNRF
jgi:hypothetical protein